MDKTQAMIHEMKAAYDWINAGEFFKAKKHLEFALDYLHDIEAAEHTLAGGRLQLVRVFDESEVEETGVGEYQIKSAAAKA